LAAGKPLQGPVDHAVPVLKVIRPNGELVAVLFGYACHPTTLSFLTWCGDIEDRISASVHRLVGEVRMTNE